MNSNSPTVKILIAIAFLAGITGLGISVTGLKMMALFPALVSIALAIAAYAIVKSRGGKMTFVYITLIVALAGTVTALVREYAIKDKVAVDENFEAIKDSSIQKGDSDPDLDANLDELEMSDDSTQADTSNSN